MKILFFLFSYLLGSIPSGYIIFWITDKKDIRNFGSGSTGATNLFRLKGLMWALPAMITDILKGAIPVYLALKIFPELEVVFLCATLAVIGHCFPVFLKFRGGKGVATSMGIYAVLAFKPFLFAMAIFVFVIAITRYVSLGSILATLSFPLIALLFKCERGIIFLGVILFIIIVIKHLGNIQHLIKGNERKVGDKVQ